MAMECIADEQFICSVTGKSSDNIVMSAQHSLRRFQIYQHVKNGYICLSSVVGTEV